MPDLTVWTEREALLLDVLLTTSAALRNAPKPAGLEPEYQRWWEGPRTLALDKVRAWDLAHPDGRQAARS